MIMSQTFKNQQHFFPAKQNRAESNKLIHQSNQIKSNETKNIQTNKETDMQSANSIQDICH